MKLINCPKCHNNMINVRIETRCIDCFRNEPKTLAVRLYNEWHMHDFESGFEIWKTETPNWVKETTYQVLGY